MRSDSARDGQARPEPAGAPTAGRQRPARRRPYHSSSRGSGNRAGGPGGRPGARPRPASGGRPPAPPQQSELDLALAAAQAAPAPAATTFRALGLPGPLVAALATQGIEEPFAIQARALPDALAGRDVLGRAQTGSGKTLAFGLPMLACLAGAAARRDRAPRGLILVPTRELAKQVANVLEPLGEPLGVTVTTVYGGASMNVQISRLRRGVDIVVATPGRLIDLLDRGAATLSGVEITVLDEADHMADLGFFPAVTRILGETPAGGQRLLFSATLDRDVERLVTTYLSEPALHAVAPVTDVATAADHQVFVLPQADKLAVATELAGRPDRTLFFVRTKHGAARLAKQMERAGVPAMAIHGNLNQNQRHRALASFAEGNPRVLVATDVAARGLHIDDVGLVVHFDPPHDHKDYLHRSGRTARAGATGTVVALVDPGQVGDVAKLHNAAGITPSSHQVEAGHPAVREVATSGTPIPPPVAKPASAGSPDGPGRRSGAGRRPRRPWGERPAAAAADAGAPAAAPSRARSPQAAGRSAGSGRSAYGNGRPTSGRPQRSEGWAGGEGRTGGSRAQRGEGRTGGSPQRGEGRTGGSPQRGGSRTAGGPQRGGQTGGARQPARPGRPRQSRPGFRQAS